LAIALTGGGEGSRSDNPILLIDDRCDMKILMGIDAANRDVFLRLPPFPASGFDQHEWLRRTECVDRTVTRP
jgi:hypothetical protein